MTEVIGVNLRHQGKVYYFNPRGKTYRRGDHVIVDTAQGIDYATVIMPNTEMDESHIKGDLKVVIRLATQDDEDQMKLNKKNEETAIKLCRERIRAHKLEMKLIRAEYSFDRAKLTFFFTADGRVDFRDLVKDLAGLFRTRIELRQVGVRDETRLLGGIGTCGRELCCATWLPDFVPVSIKMAKEQNLSLNSAKISGCCGRLMCCLKNEAETYSYLNANLPDVNQMVRTPEGVDAKVKSVNILKQTVSVIIDEDKDEREIKEYPVADLSFKRSAKKEKKLSQRDEKFSEDDDKLSEEDVKALEALED